MAKYVYPAVFTEEAEGGYSIAFPDVPGCFTGAETLEEGIAMAQDALCLMLYDLEEAKREINKPTQIQNVHTEANEFVTLISCDTLEYRKFFNNKAVKKTLSIPAWLNTMAEREELNFSAVLQEALKAKLNI